MTGWVPGALAVIKVSEWPRNAGRVVTLHKMLAVVELGPVWYATDGKLFDGWDARHLPNKVHWESPDLAIHQWKLRLLGDDEETEDDAEGIRHVIEA